MSLHPNDVPLWLYSANYFLEHGRVDEAKVFYEQLFRQYPNNPDVLLARAKLALRLTNDPNAAIPIVQRALQAAPGHPGARQFANELQQRINESEK